jgi:hypothetical protein
VKNWFLKIDCFHKFVNLYRYATATTRTKHQHAGEESHVVRLENFRDASGPRPATAPAVAPTPAAARASSSKAPRPAAAEGGWNDTTTVKTTTRKAPPSPAKRPGSAGSAGAGAGAGAGPSSAPAYPAHSRPTHTSQPQRQQQQHVSFEAFEGTAEEEDAAVMLQRVARGRAARKRVQGLRDERHEAAREEVAAVRVQALQRGRMDRKRVDDIKARRIADEADYALAVGVARLIHHVILQSKQPLITASVFRVINLTPGSDDLGLALFTTLFCSQNNN